MKYNIGVKMMENNTGATHRKDCTMEKERTQDVYRKFYRNGKACGGKMG